MIINRFRSRAPISELCGWLSLPESVYHYKPGTGKRGARPSVYTLRSDGTRVDNAQVLEDIRSTLTTEFCCYGYRNVTSVLRDKDYLCIPAILTPCSGNLTPDIGFTVAVSQAPAIAIGRQSR